MEGTGPQGLGAWQGRPAAVVEFGEAGKTGCVSFLFLISASVLLIHPCFLALGHFCTKASKPF